MSPHTNPMIFRMGSPGRDGRRGVALITVLGLLSVLTLLSVSFAILMRIERVAARNFANSVRAQEMMQAGLVQATDKIQHSMVGRCYPNWTNTTPAKVRDAMVSDGDGTIFVTNILSEGGVSNYVPTSFFDDAERAAKFCGWSNVVFGSSSGRIAFVVINCSGLFDANYVGGQPYSNRTRVGEIDLSSLPEIKDAEDFATKRTEHITYESIVELKKLQSNTGLKTGRSIASFMSYSYDPGRDEVFTNYNLLGKGTSSNLLQKFNVNSFRNIFPFPSETAPTLKDYQLGDVDTPFYEYYTNISSYLRGEGTFAQKGKLKKSADVMENLLNYMDDNRIPQTTDPTETPDPWAQSEGGEDTPLISEICLQQWRPGYPANCGNDTGPLSNYGIGAGLSNDPEAVKNVYEFVVELWYPFIPNNVADGEFTLQINVYSNDWSHGAIKANGVCNGNSGVSSDRISTLRAEPWSIDIPIGPMSFFGSAGPQFRTYKSPPIFLGTTIDLSSPVSNVLVRLLPIGYPAYTLSGTADALVKTNVPFAPQSFDCACVIPEGTKTPTEIVDIYGVTNVSVFRAYILPRVLLTKPVNGVTHICDQGGSYKQNNCGTDAGPEKWWPWQPFPLLTSKNGTPFVPYGKEVGDPRSNNRNPYWGFGSPPSQGRLTYAGQDTLGTTNAATTNGTLFSRVGQGVPIFFRDGPLQNICELGNIYQGNLEYWPEIPLAERYGQSVHILDYDNGGFLLDRLTVRATNDPLQEPMHGLISPNTLNTNLLAALFNNIVIGTNDPMPTASDSPKGYARWLKASDPEVANLVRTITNDGPYWCYQDFFYRQTNVSTTYGGTTYTTNSSFLGEQIKKLTKTGNGALPYDYMSENAFAQIVDLLTFRQNLFQIIIAAQILSDEGVPIAESRALATVYRDSYTGRYFIRSFQWLGD